MGKLTSTNFDFSKARDDGFDIRFTSSDGITLLKYERDRHDSATSAAEYWVKIPSVASTTDTDFYIYYGKSDAADGADPTAVWDANFKAVWHLKDITTSTVDDSTVNANNGTKKAASDPPEVDAKIAKGQRFDEGTTVGTGNYINMGSSSTLNSTSAMTVSAWVNFDTVNTGGGSVDEDFYIGRDKSGARAYCMGSSADGPWQLQINGADIPFSPALGTPVVGTWYFVTVAGNSDGWNFYLDDGSPSTSTWSAPAAVDEFTYLGRRGYVGNEADYDGILDEVRISDIARSAAWIKADYNSENDTLLTYGPEQIKIRLSTLPLLKVG